MPRPRLVAAFVAVLALALTTSLTACVQQPSHPFVAATKADAKWGQAPQRVSGVTFQPDVVIVDGGGSSVEQVTSDGLTWVLKKSAPGVEKLRVGSVMFVTGDGVGRVIDLRNGGGAVVVTISPVNVTDVIKDGDFAATKPIPLDSGSIALGTPSIYTDDALLDQVGQPDAFTAPEDVSGGSGQGIHRPRDIPVPVPIPNPAIPQLPDGVKRTLATGGQVAQQVQQQDGNFIVTRSLKPQAEGTSFTYDHGGVRLVGSLNLTTTKPTAEFQLKIAGGGITLAEFKLSGAAALHTNIEAATAPGNQVNETSKWIGESLAFQIPIGTILGVPFSLWVGNQFKIQVRLPGDSDIKANGDFSLAAALGASYSNGGFHNLTGGNFDAVATIQKSDSLSVGITGLTVWDAINFRVGIGWLGFTAGVDFTLDFRVNVEFGAPIGYNISPEADKPIEKCTRVSGYLGAEYGVGLSMPSPVLAVVNWFRNVFNSPPLPKDIKEHGKTDIKDINKIYPASGFCQ